MNQLAASAAAPLSASHDLFLGVLSGADAASLRRSHFEQVRPGRGSGRYHASYLYPASYSILVRAADPVLAARRCVWRSPAGRAEGVCGSEVSLALGPGRRRGDDWMIEAEVHFSVDGGPEQAVPVSFRDELVVALGDSYISGEGNPDVPSVISERPRPVFARANWGRNLASGDYRRAEWWDESCHRSLLSWPVLASLAYAAQRPQQATTLVHLGCSGAIVNDVMTRGEQGLPGGGNEPEREYQLAQLNRLLDRPRGEPEQRTPDRILLSIGGNDAGFVGVIATIVVPPEAYTVPGAQAAVGWIGGAICPYDDSGDELEQLCNSSAQTRLRGLPISYARLARALARPGWGQVHQFEYPNSALGAGEEPCNVDMPRDPAGPQEMSGFEALMGRFPSLFQGSHYSWDFILRYRPELGPPQGGTIGATGCDFTPEPTDSEICQALWVFATLNNTVRANGAAAPGPGWNIVGSHLAAISGHGVCRRDPLPPALPRVRAGAWDQGWSPSRYRPYDMANERWFRTPNDSIVTQYGDRSHFHHGTFHPTFRAHLEYAEAALREALAD